MEGFTIAVSVYEALTFAVVFATLVVMILDFNKPKNNHLIHFSELIDGYFV
ncbi:hypothetical protein RAZ75_000262 [Listeria monocytogenes]|nr:hypothetical protein [Listeria monocytogenes]EKZ1167569.1 hypothetical protein [Listeria monocytogenes]HEL8191666.1 hypothetical protein [Listeria monocytogenes]